MHHLLTEDNWILFLNVPQLNGTSLAFFTEPEITLILPVRCTDPYLSGSSLQKLAAKINGIKRFNQIKALFYKRKPDCWGRIEEGLKRIF
jgi:hypothetical protein